MSIPDLLPGHPGLGLLLHPRQLVLPLPGEALQGQVEVPQGDVLLPQLSPGGPHLLLEPVPLARSGLQSGF